MKKIIPVILLSACALFIFSCSSIPYKIDIDQGNFITQKEVAQLEVGMTKKQVALILGTPLLIDTFNQERWDYYQYYRNGRTQNVLKGKLSIFFKDNLIDHINAQDLTEIKQEPVHYDRLSNSL